MDVIFTRHENKFKGKRPTWAICNLQLFTCDVVSSLKVGPSVGWDPFIARIEFEKDHLNGMWAGLAKRLLPGQVGNSILEREKRLKRLEIVGERRKALPWEHSQCRIYTLFGWQMRMETFGRCRDFLFAFLLWRAPANTGSGFIRLGKNNYSTFIASNSQKKSCLCPGSCSWDTKWTKSRTELQSERFFACIAIRCRIRGANQRNVEKITFDSVSFRTYYICQMHRAANKFSGLEKLRQFCKCHSSSMSLLSTFGWESEAAFLSQYIVIKRRRLRGAH